jgi:uncharacterized membrane protein
VNIAQTVAEFVALFSCGLFAGAAAYITFVEHPARVACGSEVAVTEFRPSYKRASVMQASLAIIGFVASLVAWWLQGGVAWLVGGLLLVSVVPITLLAIFPTNRQLLDPSLDVRSTHAAFLLRRWGQLHAIRTVLSVIAFLILLYPVA